MTRQGMKLLTAGLLALSAFACFDDPVSDLQGGPARVALSRRFLQHNVGDSTVINVQVVDAQGNPLTLSNVTYTSADPAVAEMIPLPDSTLREFPNQTLTKAVVAAKSPGSTTIVVAANGISDTLSIIVYPVFFLGTMSPTAPKPGDTVTITATAPVTFSNTANVTTVGATNLGFVSRTATTLKFVAGGETDEIRVTGALLLGSIALPSLQIQNGAIVQPGEGANDAPQGATPVASTQIARPANVGDSVVVWGSLSGSDVDDYWAITANANDSIDVRIDWPKPTGTDLDIDGLLFRQNGTTLVKCPCTGANPERTQYRVPATEFLYLEVNMYDNHGHTENWPYRVTVWRR